MEATEHLSESRAARNVVLTAGIAGLGGLLFGYDTGVIAGALLFIKPDFHLDSIEAGLVVSAVPIGAVLGAALAGPLSDGKGRRGTILLSAIIFAVGALGSAAAPGTAELVIARLVVGAAIGVASATAPVYISEVAPPDKRGFLVTFFQLAVTVGIVVAYLVGLAFNSGGEWRWMLGLGAVPAVILAIGMLEMPQSPRWLVMAGKDYVARVTLSKIRVDDPAAIDRELEEIKESLDVKAGGWRDLLHPVVKAALFVGVGLAILQQITGINTVIYYAPTIVQFTGVNSSASAILAAVGVGVVNVGMTVVALRLLDRAGRRTLLLGGVSAMVISLLALGAAFIGGGGSTGASIIAIGSLMLYVAAFAISLGPIFWLMNAEIYPLNVRSKAASVGTMANWTFNAIVSLTFLVLIDALGRSGAFWLYGGIGLLTLWFCWRFVPETKGKHLEDITEIFRRRAAKKGPTPTAKPPPPEPPPTAPA
jgi:sugar porter (SP) family MFS transporter